MSTSNEVAAMRLALEALKDIHVGNMTPMAEEYWNKAIKAIEEALAKQEQGEPVAFIEKSQFDLMLTKANLELVQKVDKLLNAQQRPSRSDMTWVGLTISECLQIEKDMMKYYDYKHECKTVCLPEFAKAIEAKLREKNSL